MWLLKNKRIFKKMTGGFTSWQWMVCLIPLSSAAFSRLKLADLQEHQRGGKQKDTGAETFVWTSELRSGSHHWSMTRLQWSWRWVRPWASSMGKCIRGGMWWWNAVSPWWNPRLQNLQYARLMDPHLLREAALNLPLLHPSLRLNACVSSYWPQLSTCNLM